MRTDGSKQRTGVCPLIFLLSREPHAPRAPPCASRRTSYALLDESHPLRRRAHPPREAFHQRFHQTNARQRASRASAVARRSRSTPIRLPYAYICPRLRPRLRCPRRRALASTTRRTCRIPRLLSTAVFSPLPPRPQHGCLPGMSAHAHAHAQRKVHHDLCIHAGHKSERTHRS